jgi:hypothetical protein
LWLQAIHQRFHRYLPLHSYLPAKLNAMVDDASRLWQLNDQDLLTHFNVHYPQHRSWQTIYQPRPKIHSTVTSALHKKRSEPVLFLDVPKQPIAIGPTGSSSANCSMWTRSSKTCTRIPLHSSKYISTDTALAPLRPAANQFDLKQWRICSAPLVRRSRHWGPRIHA